jgi:hypothetical protein
MKSVVIIMLKWLFVSLCVTGVLWITSQFLGKSIPVYSYDKELELWVLKENSEVVQRLEGFAISCYGRYGLNKALWARKDQFKTNIFLFGDSFIEALNVADENKPDSVLTRHLEKMLGQKKLLVWGVGESGLSVAGQIVKMSKYEKVLGKPLVYVIFTTGVENDFGPEVSDSRAKLVSNPEWQIVKQPDGLFHGGGKTRDLFGRFRVNFVRDIINNLKSLREGRLVFFRIPKKAAFLESTSADNLNWNRRLSQSTEFLLTRLREQTDAPILIVYCPRLPRIQRGVVDCVDHDAADAMMLQSTACRNGIDFLNLSSVLVDAYQKQQVLCMGFQNGQLGYGHLNERGIEIVFLEIAKYLKDKYVVHTN